MTALQLNASIYRDMSLIAEDETLLRRAAKYLHKLVAEKKKDPTLFSKEDYFSRIDDAKKDITEGKGHRFSTVDELDQYIKSL